MTYNMTAFSTANNIFEMYSAVNTSSGNYLVYLSLIFLFLIITIILLPNNPPAESVVAASATCTLVSLLCFALGLVPDKWVMGFGIIFAISSIMIFVNR